MFLITTEQVTASVTLYNCIWQVALSNLGGLPTFLAEVLMVFLSVFSECMDITLE
jgi:hypothetical protein